MFIRILLFQSVSFGDIMPIVDGPEYLALNIGDEITHLNGQWRLVQVLSTEVNQ
jgi:hypothetical protein